MLQNGKFYALLGVLVMQLNTVNAQDEYATIDLSVAQRNYHIPSQFAFQVDEDEIVVVSTDLRYTHNGFGNPVQFNQNTFGLMVTGGQAWWQGPNEVLAPASRGGAIGNRLPGPTAFSSAGDVGWVENWITHESLGVNPTANLDPDTLEDDFPTPLPVEDRVDQVSQWLRYDWVLEGGGDYIEAYAAICRVTDDEGLPLLDDLSCWEMDENDEGFIGSTTPYELNSAGERGGWSDEVDLYAGFSTGWTEVENRPEEVQQRFDNVDENPAANGDGLISKEEATNFKRVDVDNFSITRISGGDSEVLFSDDFSTYAPGAAIGGGLNPDPPVDGEPIHLWNPKWTTGNPGPDEIDDSGDEDTSQQALFVRDGVFVAPASCVIPEGGVAADFDGNGTVEFADFLLLSTNFGQEVMTYQEGDANCDGQVAFDDFLVLSSNFGQTAGAASVPEPSSAALLLFGLFGFAIRSRR